MGGERTRKYEDVVEINDNEIVRELHEDMIHEGLERGREVG